jgi:hypothetical protein
MKRFIEGHDRSQSTLFPERLEDRIGGDNPVRVIWPAPIKWSSLQVRVWRWLS